MLQKPIIGLAPMDGVTDAAFRYIVDTYGKPDLLITEYVSVDAIEHGGLTVLSSLIHHQTKTSTIAQLLGNDPSLFYKAVFICLELGFDGIDINMGCPDFSVINRGAGGGLIRDPNCALSIVKEVKRAICHWNDGMSIEDVNVQRDVINWIQTTNKRFSIKPKKRKISISLKTRIGFDKPDIQAWISQFKGCKLDFITIHGRTVKQRYTGKVNWDEIAKASKILSNQKTYVLGNGNVRSISEAHEKCLKYNLDGILIGRAAWGNPWIFSDKIPSFHERMAVMIEHCRKLHDMTPDVPFITLRKHLGWYCKGFAHSASVRSELMGVQNLADVEKIVSSLSK